MKLDYKFYNEEDLQKIFDRIMKDNPIIEYKIKDVLCEITLLNKASIEIEKVFRVGEIYVRFAKFENPFIDFEWIFEINIIWEER